MRIQWVFKKSNLFGKNVMSGHPVGDEKPVRIHQWESRGRRQSKYIFQWASLFFQKLLKESGRKKSPPDLFGKCGETLEADWIRTSTLSTFSFTLRLRHYSHSGCQPEKL